MGVNTRSEAQPLEGWVWGWEAGLEEQGQNPPIPTHYLLLSCWADKMLLSVIQVLTAVLREF